MNAFLALMMKTAAMKRVESKEEAQVEIVKVVGPGTSRELNLDVK